MEFIGEGRELVPDAALPLVEAPCWFCSPSVSMAAGDTDETSISQTRRQMHRRDSAFHWTECLTDKVLVRLDRTGPDWENTDRHLTPFLKQLIIMIQCPKKWLFAEKAVKVYFTPYLLHGHQVHREALKLNIYLWNKTITEGLIKLNTHNHLHRFF